MFADLHNKIILSKNTIVKAYTMYITCKNDHSFARDKKHTQQTSIISTNECYISQCMNTWLAHITKAQH